jgi:hypothetical protein
LKDYAGLVLRQALLLLYDPDGNLKYFRLLSRYFRKKRKSAAENSVRLREIRWLNEGARGMLTSIVSISELWMRQLEAFFWC